MHVLQGTNQTVHERFQLTRHRATRTGNWWPHACRPSHLHRAACWHNIRSTSYTLLTKEVQGRAGASS